MRSLLADLGIELLMSFPLYSIVILMTYAFIRWCVKWKAGQVLCGLFLVGFAAGTIYGLLRASEVILYPGEEVRAWSGYFYDTNIRTEGIKLTVPCALELAAVLAAGWPVIRKRAFK